MSFLKSYLPRSLAISRSLRTAPALFKKAIASFEEVKAAGNNERILLIDVREPNELKETGVIPGSINIPLGDVEIALAKVSNEDFKRSYNREKPSNNSEIIFSCKLGKRSEQAQDIAGKLGYTNVKNFSGGWSEWEKHLKP